MSPDDAVRSSRTFARRSDFVVSMPANGAGNPAAPLDAASEDQTMTQLDPSTVATPLVRHSGDPVVTGEPGQQPPARPGDAPVPPSAPPSSPPAFPPGFPLRGRQPRRIGDRVFRGVSVGAGTVVLVLMAAIAVFLVVKAAPAIRADDTNFFTTQDWLPDNAGPGNKNVFGIAALLFHTLTTSVVAMVLAVPVAVGTALFITHYAPRRLAALMGYLVDLLAAVPSIVYGLWGFAFLAPHMTGLVLWLDRWLGWVPFFDYRPDNLPNNRSDLTAGIVLAIMILPIISSISREIFRQVPRDNIEAALALGATRWEMVRTSVLPYGASGVLSASVLGLGRALGETLAVTLILASAYSVNIHITENGGVTFASNIANKYGEAGVVGTGALIASGLCLFVITLLVNFGGSLLIRRGGRGA